MPINTRAALLCPAVLCALMAGGAAAQQPSADDAPVHHVQKAKSRAGAPMPDKTPMAVDDWFSYGAPKEAEIEREAPGVKIRVPEEPGYGEDLIVYGKRQKRDFTDIARGSDLTSPQALDAAQPMVPGIGNSCSYKTGCFDSSQESLRDSIPALLGGN